MVKSPRGLGTICPRSDRKNVPGVSTCQDSRLRLALRWESRRQLIRNILAIFTICYAFTLAVTGYTGGLAIAVIITAFFISKVEEPEQSFEFKDPV